MARYIDETDVYKLVEPRGVAKVHCSQIDELPRANVVPKSEVEKIFAEIERFLYMHFRFCKEEIGNDDTEYLKGRLELNTQIQNFIAELKKKYTENI